jgi:hypothetical protein
VSFIKVCDFIKDDDVVTHALRIMGNGVLIVPPHEFEHPSRWYYQSLEIKKHRSGLCFNGMISTPNFMKIRSPVPIYMAETVVRKTTDRWQHDLFG